jgi:hypothetical protein
MKIRSGFVSNSSSSSFVVAFPKTMPLTVDAIQEYVFGSIDGAVDYPYGHESLTTKRAAEIILDDIQNRQSDDRRDILQIIGNGFDNAPEFDYDKYFKLPADKKDAYHQEFEMKMEIFLKSVEGGLKDLEDKFVLYKFEFSDNDGTEQTIMEHGSVFDRVKHWHQSNH